MSEEIKIQALSKEGIYKELIPQIQSLMHGENDMIANMANVSAVLRQAFNFFWVGFYIVKNNQLVLGPFQGPVACTRINKGKGVCGTAWDKQQTIIVEDVEKFPGHIACNALSKSEIVLPLFDINKNVWAVLDVDSDELNSFDETDAKYLNEIISFVKKN